MVLTPDEKTLLRNRYRHFRRENEVTAFEKTLGWYRRWYHELVGQEMSQEHGKDITDFVLKLESEMEMPHLGHAKHLCYLAESGMIDIESYKALVKNAKFLFRACGRAAAKEENLCEPMPL